MSRHVTQSGLECNNLTRASVIFQLHDVVIQQGPDNIPEIVQSKVLDVVDYIPELGTRRRNTCCDNLTTF